MSEKWRSGSCIFSWISSDRFSYLWLVRLIRRWPWPNSVSRSHRSCGRRDSTLPLMDARLRSRSWSTIQLRTAETNNRFHDNEKINSRILNRHAYVQLLTSVERIAIAKKCWSYYWTNYVCSMEDSVTSCRGIRRVSILLMYTNEIMWKFVLSASLSVKSCTLYSLSVLDSHE